MKELTLLGVKINNVSRVDLLDEITSSINSGRIFRLYTVNNEFIVEAQKNSKYRKVLNESTASVADSAGVVWAIRRNLNTTIERIPGVDLFFDILRNAERENFSVFLLGGGIGVGRETKAIIEKKYPQLKIAGYRDGIVINPERENTELIDEINTSSADILFVALGYPKQELWIDKNQNKLKAKLLMGVGGTLDFASGRIKRAPEFMRKNYLEWLYRLIQQPSRAGRIYRAVVTFSLMVLSDKKQS